MFSKLIISCLLFTLINGWFETTTDGCAPKYFGYGSFVCVCNVSYCDSLQQIKLPYAGHIVSVVSSKNSKRWNVKQQPFSSTIDGEADIVIKLNRSERFQVILGFGGAFTDASGINIKSVPEPLQEKVISGYFGLNGLEYSLGRIPIGGTDFSTHPYSYDDLPADKTDPYLKKFSLAQEDLKYKIPIIQKALNLSAERGVQMKLYGSPWSGPAWMKDNGKINGKGKLLKKFYPCWASYIIRFIEEYEKHNIPIFGITTQNEPTTGFIANYPFNTMGWTPEEQAEWIGYHLGPQLHKSGHENVTIFILDDSRPLLPQWAIRVMKNEVAAKYVGGIAVHYYWDWLSSPRLLDLTHSYFPHLPILYTEACTGSEAWDLKRVTPGSWVRAEYYAYDIINNLQHWAVGWTDWNLALDLQGGPNWVQNFVDSPILVNQGTEEIYKQPMFYILAHFSKVIGEGSVRIQTIVEGEKKYLLKIVTFKRPDSAYAAIILNRNRRMLSVEIQDDGKKFQTILEPRSVNSFIWNL